MFNQTKDIRVQKLNSQFLIDNEVSISALRLDEIHPDISGNKWFKLKYNILEAQQKGFNTVLTFGGAFSNHLVATASASSELNIKSIGIVRGEEHFPLNSTLSKCKEFGMKIHYMDRTTYREKNTESVLNGLKTKFGKCYFIPEGGTNELAVKGTSEILNNIKEKYDYVACAVGTGGTIAGIINSSNDTVKTLGFPALKGDFLKEEIEKYTSKTNFELILDYHFGGYAKHKPELIEFINWFKNEFDIPLDPIYTGKMMYGIFDLLKLGYFHKKSRILVIHTGGLQGLIGFNTRFGNLLQI